MKIVYHYALESIINNKNTCLIISNDVKKNY